MKMKIFLLCMYEVAFLHEQLRELSQIIIIFFNLRYFLRVCAHSSPSQIKQVAAYREVTFTDSLMEIWS